MSKSKLEYIWLDGYLPTANLRGKTKIVSDFGGKLEDCPYGLSMVLQLNKLREALQTVC